MKTAKKGVIGWPKNKAEHRKNQMWLWGGEEGLKGFETRELNTASGKKCTYHVRVDPSGRMWIADTGEDAPAGYYSQSSKYYVLTRNVRIAGDAPDFQRVIWAVHLSGMKLPGGFLEQLGNCGLIRKLDGKYAEMNFSRCKTMRKWIDESAAYDAEHGRDVGQDKAERQSRYIIKIEQAKIKPGAPEACWQ